MTSPQVQHVDAGSVSEQTVTFSDRSLPGDVRMTSGEQTLSSDDLTDLVNDLLEFTGGDECEGYFGITQTGESWFGHGLRNFVDLISKQYDSLPGDRSTHHREIATWVGPGGPGGTMVLSGQPRTKSKAVDRFIVTLVMNGYPLNLQFLNEISELPVKFGNAHKWDRPRYEISRERCGQLPVTDISQEIISNDIDKQIDEIVFRNPFYNRADDLGEMLGLQDSEEASRLYQSLAEYERVRAHVLTPYYSKENPDGFKIRRFELIDLTDVTAISVGTVNIKVHVQPNL